MPTWSRSAGSAARSRTGTSTRSGGHQPTWNGNCGSSGNKHSRRAGTSPVIEALVHVVEVTGDRATALQDLAKQIPGALPADLARTPFLLIGTHEEMAAQLLRHARELAITSYVVREPAVPDQRR